MERKLLKYWYEETETLFTGNSKKNIIGTLKLLKEPCYDHKSIPIDF